MKKRSDPDENVDAGVEEASEWEQGSDEALQAAVEEAVHQEQLKDALGKKAKEAEEAQERYLRTYADFENYRKRMQRENADFRKYANEQFALELLPVIDHLALALKHAQEAGEKNEGLRQGVEMVHKQFLDVLEKFGVRPFRSAGEPFDPVKHDAMMQEMTDSVPENTVVQVFQEGYEYHDKVLRHARVSVAKRPEPGSESEE